MDGKSKEFRERADRCDSLAAAAHDAGKRDEALGLMRSGRCRSRQRRQGQGLFWPRGRYG
jgi:hypothetical protein